MQSLRIQTPLLRDGYKVTHGIFSKGRDLEGIDAVYTTDSYRTEEET